MRKAKRSIGIIWHYMEYEYHNEWYSYYAPIARNGDFVDSKTGQVADFVEPIKESDFNEDFVDLVSDEE